MIEQGNTKTEYEQYAGGMLTPSPDMPSEVQSCGENINLINIATLIDGFITNTGTIDTSGVEGEMTSELIEVKANTPYTFKIIETNSTYNKWIAFSQYDGNENFIKRDSANNVNPYTIVTGNVTKYIRISAKNLKQAKKIKLEKSYIATSFSPYGMGSASVKMANNDNTESETYTIPVSEPMRKIGDYEDTFVKKDGKWYFKKAIGRYTFTGNENWNFADSNTIYTFEVNNSIDRAKIETKGSNKNLLNCYSNRLIKSTQENVAGGSNRIAFSQWGSQYIYISKIVNTINGLKEYLANNETYVVYPLETPIETEVTNQATIDVLEEIYNNAKTYKNVTHIYSEDEISPNVTVEYRKDLETMFNNLTSAVVALGGDINV